MIEASWFIMQEGMIEGPGLDEFGHADSGLDVGSWMGSELRDALLHRPVWASRARVLA